MSRSQNFLRVSMVLGLSAFVIAPLNAQRSGAVSWFVGVVDADIVMSETRTFRLYGTPNHLSLRITLSNESTSSLIVTRSTLTEGFSFTVDSGGEIPIVVEWHTQVKQLVTPGASAKSADVQLDSGKGAEWTVTLQRADKRPFRAGRYEVRIALDLSTARDVDGGQWRGRVLYNSTVLHAITGEPSGSPEDRAAALGQIARKAMAAQRWDDAASALQAVAALLPSDPGPLIELGTIYNRQLRYRDAVVQLERAMSMQPKGRTFIPQSLAMAYVGLGEEANATRVLRDAGVSQERAEAEIVRLRSVVAARRPK